MKNIAVIINGTRLPYHVIHHAIEKAKENSSGILALFLKGNREPSKGYGFPSDIQTAGRADFDNTAVRDDESIIADNMDIVKQMVEDEKIFFQSSLKTNASVDEVAEIISSAEVLVLDENFDDLTLLGDDKISLKALKKKINIPIDVAVEK